MSKYTPHQGKKECARRVAKPEGQRKKMYINYTGAKAKELAKKRIKT